MRCSFSVVNADAVININAAVNVQSFFKSIVVCFTYLLLFNNCWFSEANAEENNVTKDIPEVPFQRIFIPKNELDNAPQGEWIPVSSSRFKKYEQWVQKKKTPSQERLMEHVEYRAQIGRSGTLTGTFVANLINLDAKKTNVTSANATSANATSANTDTKVAYSAVLLSETNLHLQKIQSVLKKERQAVWGTDASGNSYVMVPQAAKKILGDWSVSGKRIAGQMEFDLTFPKSLRSTFLLTLPQQWDVSSSGGRIVEKKVEKLVNQKTKTTTWKIAIGQESQCRLRIKTAEFAGNQKLAIFNQEKISWFLKQDTAIFQAEYLFEFLGKSTSQLSWKIPEHFQVESITLSNDLLLKYRIAEGKQTRFLIVQLEQPVKGVGRPVVIRGRMKMESSQPWKVPYLVPRYAITTKSQLGIRIDQQLELKNYTETGFQQTAIVSELSQGILLRFEKILPDAQLKLTLASPQTELTSRSVNHLSLSEFEWTLNSTMVLEARNGQENVVRFRIPAGWEIQSVNATTINEDSIPLSRKTLLKAKSSLGQTENKELIGWRVLERSLHKELEIQLSNPITQDHTQAIFIQAHSTKLTQSSRQMMPMFDLQQAYNQEGVIVLKPEKYWVITPSSPNSKRAKLELPFIQQYVSRSVPLSWSHSAFWETHWEVGSPLQWHLKKSAIAKGQFDITPSGETLTAPVIVRCQTADQILTGTVEIGSESFPPSWNQRASTEHRHQPLIVYSPSKEIFPQWSVSFSGQNTSRESKKSAPLQVKKIDLLSETNRISETNRNLPSEGQLWELFLPQGESIETLEKKWLDSTALQSSKQRLEISMRWNQPILSKTTLPLFFLVHSSHTSLHAASGQLELAIPKGLQVTLVSSGAVKSGRQEVALSSENNTSYDMKRFSYSGYTDKIVLKRESSIVQSDLVSAPLLELRTRIPTDANQLTEHRAIYQWKRGIDVNDVQISIPANMTLFAVRVDNKPLPINHNHASLKLPQTENGKLRTIEILFASSQQTRPITSVYKIALPQLSTPPVAMRWQIEGASPEQIVFYGKSYPPENRRWQYRLKSALLGPFLYWGQEKLNNGSKNNTRHHCDFRDLVAEESLMFQVLNQSRLQMVSWFLFLATLFVSLLTKSISKEFGKKAAFVLLATSLSVCCFLIPPFVPLFGAIALGALMALLLPCEWLRLYWGVDLFRSLITQFSKPTSSTVSELSTTGKQQLPSVLLFAILFLSCEQISIAQTPPAKNSVTKPTPNRHSVLVPYTIDQSKKRTLDAKIRYVSPALNRQMTIMEQDGQSKRLPLFEKAIYHLEMNQRSTVRIRAVFHVATAANRTTSTPVLLPLTGVTFDGDDCCHVDGKVAELNRQAGEKGIQVSIPPPVLGKNKKPSLTPPLFSHHRIEIVFIPTVAVREETSSLEVDIPRIPATYVQIDFPQTGETISTVRFDGSILSHRAGKTPLKKPLWIGSTGLLRLFWSQKETPLLTISELSANVAAHVHVQPNLIQTKFRIQCFVLKGQARSLFLTFPSKTIIKSVEGDEVLHAIPILLGSGLTRLVIRLKKPMTDDFTIEVETALSSRFLDHSIRVPAFELFQRNLGNVRIRTGQQMVGFSTEEGFDATYTGVIPEISSPIPPEQFYQQWGENPPLLSKKGAFQQASPTAFLAKLTQKQDQVLIHLSQKIILQPTETVLQAEADITPGNMPIFRYQVQCDPTFRLEHASILQDGVERLLKWERTQNRITLFLKGATVTAQKLILSGRFLDRPDSQVKIFPLRFLNATPESHHFLEIQKLQSSHTATVQMVHDMTSLDMSNIPDEKLSSENDSRLQFNFQYQIDSHNAYFVVQYPKPKKMTANTAVSSADENSTSTHLPIPLGAVASTQHQKSASVISISHHVSSNTKGDIIGETIAWIDRKTASSMSRWNHPQGAKLLSVEENDRPVSTAYQTEEDWMIPLQAAKKITQIQIVWSIPSSQAVALLENSLLLPEPIGAAVKTRFLAMNSQNGELRFYSPIPLENFDVTIDAGLESFLNLVNQDLKNHPEAIPNARIARWLELLAVIQKSFEKNRSQKKALPTTSQKQVHSSEATAMILKKNLRTLLMQRGYLQENSVAILDQTRWEITDSPEIRIYRGNKQYTIFPVLSRLIVLILGMFLAIRFGLFQLDHKIQKHPRWALFLLCIGTFALFQFPLSGW